MVLGYITQLLWHRQRDRNPKMGARCFSLSLFNYCEREREREGISGGGAETEGERESQAGAAALQSLTQGSVLQTVKS